MSRADGAASAAREVRCWLEQLLGAAPQIGDALPDDFAARAEAYAALLLHANQRLNLTRVTEPYEVARLHILDAVAAIGLVDETGAQAAVDLGSGGGVPGIPLAIARPEVRWLLVDSVGKKVAVLQEFIDELGLANVSVISERAETLGQSSEHRERYDLVAARACAALPVLAELALPLLSVGGTLIAWKGPLADEDAELRRGRAAAALLGAGEVRVLPASEPVLGGHTFVMATKERPTPAGYPRRPGEPGRRPLD
ncbi:MAG TPA: 16S rRNA (guanine(527)-N(7))-methyltransferase RsmG [Candidatus Limnocylindria bacterium]|nr:16S rRNA (guanine(527)-N(7))-methyltransferase RsmG [Candidatus Limnocylindria bacterium]